jgi:hypothetical protein
MKEKGNKKYDGGGTYAELFAKWRTDGELIGSTRNIWLNFFN